MGSCSTANRICRMALLAGLLAGGSGCAATSGNALTAALNDEVRRLTMQCYWDREGERMVVGGMHVYQACRRWAQDRVQPRVPGASVARAD